MKFLLLLHHADAEPAALAKYFAALGDAGAVLATERIVPGEGAAVSISGDARSAPITVSRDLSGLRAAWAVETPSKQAAVDIARGIPGASGEIDVYELFGPPEWPTPSLPAGTRRYLTLVRADAQSESGAPPSQAVMEEMSGWMDNLSPPMLGGGGLAPSSRAVRLRRSADARNVVDGPFAESKELVAGFGIIAARSLDDAIDTIRPWLRIHHAHTPAPTSTLEVRALV